ncbi:hypothetical protein [Sinisalibacter aestuarii]|uniref:Uncharacterized protein n=1 Tax=Sinisalibacter aestuarii TaxID=2949426 RepID=A0ABQ5LS90_9RHOB|nr:hypothetical protein [Sinisalibacter aestuarii]GKY87856.1 hypothetical protein STA1M1_17250 [Sinisalibacter aestuarii]
MRRIFSALAACILIPAAAGAGPFDGLYRPNDDWAERWDCQSVGMEGGALEITGTTITGVDNACTLADPVEVRGLNAVLYDRTCTGEGEPYSERLMLMGHDFGVYVITDGLVLDWLRCD